MVRKSDRIRFESSEKNSSFSETGRRVIRMGVDANKFL